SLVATSVSLSFFFSSRRRHTRFSRDWSSDVCSSDLSAFVILLAAALLSAAVQAAPEDPRTVVERATNGIINDLNKLTLEQRTDAEIRRLVMTWIIPAIDQQRIAMGALGKHWRRATPEQRQAFIDRYRELQI